MHKTHVFFSSVGNIGTTSLTLSVGSAIAARTDARVGVLSLNAWDDGSDYGPVPQFYLDDLKSRLSGRMFSDDDDFLGKFTEVVKDRFYVLAGNKNRRMEREYTTDEIQYLIERSKEMFDLVLIDAGNNIDNALSLMSFVESDEKWLVLSQQTKSLKRFKQLYEDIILPINVHKNDLNICINQYQERNYLMTDKQIEKELGIRNSWLIPHIENGWIAEIENTILYDLEVVNVKFKNAIDLLAADVAEKSAIKLNELEQKKRFKIFG